MLLTLCSTWAVGLSLPFQLLSVWTPLVTASCCIALASSGCLSC
jgi:hypothetical protein